MCSERVRKAGTAATTASPCSGRSGAPDRPRGARSFAGVAVPDVAERARPDSRTDADRIEGVEDQLTPIGGSEPVFGHQMRGPAQIGGPGPDPLNGDPVALTRFAFVVGDPPPVLPVGGREGGTGRGPFSAPAARRVPPHGARAVLHQLQAHVAHGEQVRPRPGLLRSGHGRHHVLRSFPARLHPMPMPMPMPRAGHRLCRSFVRGPQGPCGTTGFRRADRRYRQPGRPPAAVLSPCLAPSRSRVAGSSYTGACDSAW